MNIPAYEALSGPEEGKDKRSGRAVDIRVGFLLTVICQEQKNSFYFQRRMQTGERDTILTLFIFSFQITVWSNLYLFAVDTHIKLLRLSLSPGVNECLR